MIKRRQNIKSDLLMSELFLFIRTAAIGLMCIFGAFIVSFVIIQLFHYFNVLTSYSAEGWIGIVCLLSAWFIYHKYFQQYIHIDGTDENTES
jgi:hypothetical protein